MGVIACPTEVLTVATARGRTILPPIGAVLRDHGVGDPQQATCAPNPSLAEDPRTPDPPASEPGSFPDAALTLWDVHSPAIASILIKSRCRTPC